MDISPVLFVGIVLGLLLIGGAAGFVLGKAHASTQRPETIQEYSQLRADAAAANARAHRLEEENGELLERAQADHNVLQALSPLAQQLDVVNRQVQNLRELQATQRAEIREQIASVDRTQSELARETSALRTALTSTSARGTWGEVELRRVVEAAGMLPHVDFSAQLTTGKLSASGSASRPDLTVHLPGGAHIAVDAKVPLDAILREQTIAGSSTEALAQRSELRLQHAKALRGHVNALAKRNYPADFPGSPQFTIMFVPAESILSQALAADGTLLEDALRAGVTPTTPSSLLALLRAVATVWASSRVTEEAQNIVALGTTLVERLNVVAGHLDSLGSSLRSSVRHYNKVIGSLESRVLVTAREFESIDTPLRTLQPLNSDDAQIRQLSSAELSPSSGTSGSSAAAGPSAMTDPSSPGLYEADRDARPLP